MKYTENHRASTTHKRHFPKSENSDEGARSHEGRRLGSDDQVFPGGRGEGYLCQGACLAIAVKLSFVINQRISFSHFI